MAATWSNNRWFILCVLFIARFCLGFQFQSAGSVAPFLVSDFGLDYGQIGTLVGLYMLPGLVVALPGGVLGKRFGDKRVVVAGLFLMILGGIVSGLGTSYAIVSFGRVISGIGAAFLFVLMTKMLTDWFAHRELFIGMSIFIIGWPVGIAAGQATQAQIAQVSGWESVFYLSAGMLAVALAAMVGFYRNASDRNNASSFGAANLTGHEIWLVCIAGSIWMLINGAYVVMLCFGPTLLLERGETVTEAARAVSVMSWVFLFALPLGGYLATRYKAPNQVMVTGLLGSVVMGLLIPFVSFPYLTFALFGIAFAIATPVIGSLPAEILRPVNRATGLGIYFLWYYIGSAATPAIGGFLRDWSGAARVPVLFAAVMMLASLGLLAILRKEQARLANAT